MNGVVCLTTSTSAKQLHAFLLHFISTNYGPVSTIHRTIGFDALSPENRSYVEEHKWPPQSYLDELAEYEKKMAGKNNLLSSNLFSIFK